MTNLAEQISRLANPAPVFHDPEDLDDGSGAQLTGKYDKDNVPEEIGVSKLRKQAITLLSDGDKKYIGKTVSRKKIDQDSDSDEQEFASGSDKEDEETNSGDGAGSDVENTPVSETRAKDNTTFMFDDRDDAEDESGEEDSEESLDEEEDEGDAKDSGEEEEEEEGPGPIQSLSRVSTAEEVEKGNAVRNQLGLWDSLLEGRIKLHKTLQLVNQLPQPGQWQHLVDAGGADYQQTMLEGQTNLKKLLDVLVRLQTSLFHQNPETKRLEEGQSSVKISHKPEEEEITSESDADSEENGEGQKKQQHHAAKRKLKMDDYPEFLAKRHKCFEQYRNDTIQKWYDKTRVASGKLTKGFSAFDQSALKQIQQILSDKPRLIRRTQLKRSAYAVVAADDHSEDMDEQQLTSESREHSKDYDDEIFDDDDFYHQLLRELIERKTMNLSDPIALSRQWLEIQKLRSKVKKKVDTKASKGRKIRYDVHRKLVNFMAPTDTCQWTDEAR
ncbi:hypothetical protein NP493_262g02006 [Ridgeia piscesae]|uniref:Protein AATF n=1 Tax=Ridgeia piscesae TaxID=27915 RepID=A0AAD9NXW8_RIDPI|nr:hypothetical protein NP493_262g02006 [Ridgeia piscesae]